jgi:endonuclease III
MKNATKYQKNIKKFLSGIDKSAAIPPADVDPIRAMIDAILAADAPRQSAKALETLEKEFVDFNELRVAPVKDIVDTLGRDFPDARRKAEEATTVLNAIFNRRNNLVLDYVEKMSKRDVRRHLGELGLSPYAAGVMMLQVFGGHAVPVDQGLVDCLEADGHIEPGSSVEEVQAFLERIILQKQAWSTHEFFRDYVAKNAKMLAKKRKSDTAKAEAQAAAEAEAEVAAEQPAAKASSAPAGKQTATAPAKAPTRKAHMRAAVKTSAKGDAKSAGSAPAKAPTRKARKRVAVKTSAKGAGKSAGSAPAKAEASGKAARAPRGARNK